MMGGSCRELFSPTIDSHLEVKEWNRSPYLVDHPALLAINSNMNRMHWPSVLSIIRVVDLVKDPCAKGFLAKSTTANPNVLVLPTS